MTVATFLVVFLSRSANFVLIRIAFKNYTLTLLNSVGAFLQHLLVLLKSNLNFYNSLWLPGCSGFLRRIFLRHYVNLTCTQY